MAQVDDYTPTGLAFIYLLERAEPHLPKLGRDLMDDVRFDESRGEFIWVGDEKAFGQRLARILYDGADLRTSIEVIDAMRRVTASPGIFEGFVEVVVKAALARTPAYLALLQKPAGSC